MLALLLSWFVSWYASKIFVRRWPNWYVLVLSVIVMFLLSISLHTLSVYLFSFLGERMTPGGAMSVGVGRGMTLVWPAAIWSIVGTFKTERARLSQANIKQANDADEFPNADAIREMRRRNRLKK